MTIHKSISGSGKVSTTTPNSKALSFSLRSFLTLVNLPGPLLVPDVSKDSSPSNHSQGNWTPISNHTTEEIHQIRVSPMLVFLSIIFFFKL